MESNGDEYEILTLAGYLNETCLYFKELINDFVDSNNTVENSNNFKTWIYFFKRNGWRKVYEYQKSNIIVLAGSKVSYFISVSEYQHYSFEQMKGSVSIFDNVNKGNCSSHTTTLKRDESYLESQDWLTNEKQLLNQKTKVKKSLNILY